MMRRHIQGDSNRLLSGMNNLRLVSLFLIAEVFHDP